MTLKRQKHETFPAVEEELQNLDQQKEPVFVWDATRAPNASDKSARVWFFKNGSTMSMYVYDKTAGAWRGPLNLT